MIFSVQKLLKKMGQSERQTVTGRTNVWKTILKSNAGKIAAAVLIISSWAAFFVMSGKVKDLRDELKLAKREVAVAETDDSATINLYLKEHQEITARYASMSPPAPQSVTAR